MGTLELQGVSKGSQTFSCGCLTQRPSSTAFIGEKKMRVKERFTILADVFGADNRDLGIASWTAPEFWFLNLALVFVWKRPPAASLALGDPLLGHDRDMRGFLYLDGPRLDKNSGNYCT